MYGLQTGITSFEAFWTKSLQEGVFSATGSASQPSAGGSTAFTGDISAAAFAIGSASRPDGVEVILYEKTGIGNGQHANNPWLQELPDPVSKVCWDNYMAMSPAFAASQGFNQGTVIEI